jgi:CubicO group peptidase (beta-lactamase class C family)
MLPELADDSASCRTLIEQKGSARPVGIFASAYIKNVIAGEVTMGLRRLSSSAPQGAWLGVLCSLALFSAAPSVGASDVKTASASLGTHLSPQRLARLDEMLDRYVAEERVPGAVALVLKDGEVAYERAVGWSDVAAGRRMTTDTVFRIASQSKAITSAAVMSLIEEGKLTLGTPLSELIPAFAAARVAVQQDDAVELVALQRPITIQDLLTHTSGYSYGTESWIAAEYEAQGFGPAAGYGWYTIDKDEAICTTIERLAQLPLVSQPGEAYVYGYSTDILGCVVERASGQPLDAFLRERFFKPLGMNDTHFFLPRVQEERLATVYASANGKFERAPEGAKGQGHFVEGPRRNFSGGAGLLSTARDYATFLEMIRNGGVHRGVRILGPRAAALMHTNQIDTLHSSTGRGFGYGFQTTDRFGANGFEGPGGFGWGGAYGSRYRVDPQAGLTLVLMIQLMPNETDIREKFETLVYQALE